MLTRETRLRPNAEEVAADILDGEAIMINLSTGMYYNMDQTGALVWELLGAGWSVGEIGSALAQRYEVSDEQADADVRRLIAQLVEENLVVVADRGTADPPAAGAPRTANHPRLPYVEPRLEIYRDVGHLVALDPPMPGLKDLPWHEPSEGPPPPRSA